MTPIPWNPVAGWMAFPHLSASRGITQTYTLGYRLKHGEGQPWTGRFNRFKNNEMVAYWGAAYLLYGALPRLMAAIGMDSRNSVFIPALASGETAANPQRHIPYLTQQCADIVQVRCSIDALQKNVHGKIHDRYRVDERTAELDKAEYRCRRLNARHVFVFDDLVTRGDTLSRIALATIEANPDALVYGIALAKNESKDWCTHPDNDHIPREWDNLWMDGEQRFAAADRR